MRDLGRTIRGREAIVVTTVHPRPPDVVFKQPAECRVATRAITCVPRAAPWWLVFSLLAVIVFSAHEIATSLGFGWPMAIAATAIVLVPPAWLVSRTRARIFLGQDALSVRGPRRHVIVRNHDIAAIETHQVANRADVRTSTYYVCVRGRDDGTTEVVSLPTREDCWWLQDLLERALAVPARPSSLRLELATTRADALATGRLRATRPRSQPS